MKKLKNPLYVFLQTKQESLAREAKYIKTQLRKYRPKNSDTEAEIHWGLKDHLKQVVAIEARATNIARAYLRGKDYAFVEPIIKREHYWKTNSNRILDGIIFPRSEDNTTWKRVVQLVAKYENKKAYKFRLGRRDFIDVEHEVIRWRNAHPQLLGQTELSV